MMTTLPAMSADEGTKRDSISAEKVTTIAAEQNTAFLVPRLSRMQVNTLKK